MKKQLKIEEDPWDNYLVHDSKYLLPLICHSQDLTLSEQILVVHFLKHTLIEENISQYKVKGAALIRELVEFARNFRDEEEQQSVMDKIEGLVRSGEEKGGVEEEEIERVVKMFQLKMQVKGMMKPYKEDYFA